MTRFPNWKEPYFDEDGWAHIRNNKEVISFNWICFHPENLKLGKDSDIGAFSILQAKYGIEIGEEVEIGPHCYLCSHSTIDNKQGKITIKKGAKIGTHSSVMPGITIGENSIVGANSFVNRDIPDNVLAYGTPCKVIKKL